MRSPDLSKIKLLAMDVDGVLTSGDIIYSSSDEEIKAFNIQDGLGLAVAGLAGLITAIVTGRASHAVQKRASELGITEVCQKVRYKSYAIKKLIEKYAIAKDEIAYIGDDINDIPAFNESGVKIAVNNASADLKKYADIFTEHNGGSGAVREVIELILRTQGKWDDAVADFLSGLEKEECGK